MAKDTFYFSHDYNTRSDSKIKKLLVAYGFLGYGLWWAIVEDLYNNANALPTDCEGIAYDLRTDEKTIKSILHDFDLFVFKEGFFGSISVQRRLEERNQKSAKARESALNRWKPKEENANALPTHSERNAIKERKGKERKGKKNTVLDIPTIDLVIGYFTENGYKKSAAEQAFKFYAEGKPAWHDSKGNPVRSWKQKMNSVWFKEENKEISKGPKPNREIGTKDKLFGG